MSKYFTMPEFGCKDGTAVPPSLWGNVDELMKNLDVIREAVGAPVYVNSGYRTPEYNKKVGGKPKSQHLLAKAADLTTKNMTPKQLYNLIEKLITQKKIKQGGLGLYPGFVHYDIRGTRARW